MLRAVFSRIFESRCIQEWIWAWGGRSREDKVEWSRVQSSSRYERQKEWILALEKTIQRKSARPVKFVVGKDKWPQRYFLQHHPEFLGKTLLSTSKVKRGNCSVGRFSRLVKGEVFSLRGSFHDWVRGGNTKLAVIHRQWMDEALLVAGEIIRKESHRKRNEAAG